MFQFYIHFILFVFILFYLIIIVLLEIPFLKDPENPKIFNIIKKRIIEADGDGCFVFLDRKIEENTNVWKMFFFLFII
jgi:hypothetical protein